MNWSRSEKNIFFNKFFCIWSILVRLCIRVFYKFQENNQIKSHRSFEKRLKYCPNFREVGSANISGRSCLQKSLVGHF